jgi:hypothetical protein
MNFHRAARIESTEARYPRNGQGDSLHAPTVSPRKFWSILDRVRGHSREEEFSAHASLLAQAAELLAALQVVEDYISREDGTRSDERFEVLYVTRAAIAKALR